MGLVLKQEQWLVAQPLGLVSGACEADCAQERCMAARQVCDEEDDSGDSGSCESSRFSWVIGA